MAKPSPCNAKNSDGKKCDLYPNHYGPHSTLKYGDIPWTDEEEND